MSSKTSDNINLTYGLGSASGNIAYTNIQLGTYQVQNQGDPYQSFL
jgi:hypothetical protein